MPTDPDGGWLKNGIGDQIPAEDNAMRYTSALMAATLGMLGATALATALCAQEGGAGKPWRGAGTPPCFAPGGRPIKCAPALGTVAIRPGQLFDRKTGQMASRPTVPTPGARSTDGPPPAPIKTPPRP